MFSRRGTRLFRKHKYPTKIRADQLDGTCLGTHIIACDRNLGASFGAVLQRIEHLGDTVVVTVTAPGDAPGGATARSHELNSYSDVTIRGRARK